MHRTVALGRPRRPERRGPGRSARLSVVGEVGLVLVREHVGVVVAAVARAEERALVDERDARVLRRRKIHRVIRHHVCDGACGRVLALFFAHLEVRRVRVVVRVAALEHARGLEHAGAIDLDGVAVEGDHVILQLDHARRLRILRTLHGLAAADHRVAAEVQVGLPVVVDEDLGIEKPHPGREAPVGDVVAVDRVGDDLLAQRVLPWAQRRAADNDGGAGAAVAEVQIHLAVLLDRGRCPRIARPRGRAAFAGDRHSAVIDPVDHVGGRHHVQPGDAAVPVGLCRQAVLVLAVQLVLLGVIGRVDVQPAVVDQVVRVGAELVPQQGIVIADRLGLHVLERGVLRCCGCIGDLHQREVVDAEVLQCVGAPGGLDEEPRGRGVTRLGGELLRERAPLAAGEGVAVVGAPVEVRRAEGEVEALCGFALVVLQASRHPVSGAELELALDIRERTRLRVLAVGDEQRVSAAGRIIAERQGAAASVGPSGKPVHEAAVRQQVAGHGWRLGGGAAGVLRGQRHVIDDERLDVGVPRRLDEQVGVVGRLRGERGADLRPLPGRRGRRRDDIALTARFGAQHDVEVLRRGPVLVLQGEFEVVLGARVEHAGDGVRGPGLEAGAAADGERLRAGSGVVALG